MAPVLKVFVASLWASVATANLTVDSLRCDYSEDPISTDSACPRLSWVLTSSGSRGVRQTAYQVLVASSDAALAADTGDVWDSGKIVSDATVGIEYAGRPLKSRMPCYWKVKVWDQDGKASAWSPAARWRMGFLERSDWKARWIGPPPADPSVTPHFGYRSLDAKNGNDTRWLQIDLGNTQTIDGIRLWGAWPYGSVPKGDGFPLRYKIEVFGDPLSSNGCTVVDRTQSDVINPGLEPVLHAFAPVRARTVRFTATKLSGNWRPVWDVTRDRWTARHEGQAGWKLALAELEVFNQGTNVARGTAVTATDSVESNASGWSARYLTDGRTGADPGVAYHLNPVTLFRRDFAASKRVLSATLYATALGCYEVYLNGVRVGADELTPGLSVPNRRTLYQAYDVSGLIKRDGNVLAALLADGWHRSRFKFDIFDSYKRFAGPEKTALLAQLEVTYEDGQSEVIATDRAWLCNTNGPLRRASMYDGVLYDARKEIPGWNTPELPDTAGWVSAVEQPVTPEPALSAQPMPPIRVLDTFAPVSRNELRPGHIVFDFGTCLAGVCRITLDGPAGTTVRLRHAEALQPDGKLFVSNLSGLYDNGDTFVLAGRGPQTFQPKFTYHGFRYVEVSGAPSADSVREIRALALGSGLKRSATFECSDDRLNRLCGIIERAYRSNLLGLVVDVAGRDERLAFLGDCLTDEIQSLAYLYDFAAFGMNENRAIIDCLTPEGIAPARLNTPGEWRGKGLEAVGEPGWSDGSISVPLGLWVNYADRRSLEQSYSGAKSFMDAIERENPDDVPRKKYIATWVGDWLATPTKRSRAAKARPGAPYDLFSHAWWAYSAQNVSHMAHALNRPEEAKRYADMAARIRSAFVKTHLRPDGSLTGDEQSCYAFALGMDLLPEPMRSSALEKLVTAVQENENHFSTGSISTIFLLKALEENGLHDLAYRLVMQPTAPSYGAMLEGGATAMWEHFGDWDLRKGLDSKSTGINGLNHLGMNSVFEWIIGHVAGIRPDPLRPGYTHFFIAPKLGGGVTWVNSSYDSVRGKIVCDWKMEKGTFSLSVTVPPNTTATVVIPAKGNSPVLEGGTEAAKALGVKALGKDEESATFRVASGEYRFVSQL